MGYASNSHRVSVRSLKRRDDRHTLPNLGQSQQRVRCATLQQNIGPDVCKAARRIEQPPDRIAGVQQQQRIGGKTADIYDARLTEIEGAGSDSQGIDGRQDPTVEARITLIKSDADVCLATLKNFCLSRTERFHELHMYVGKPLGISR